MPFDSGFQKRLCFHLPLLHSLGWMKNLAVYQGLSHLHPDPLQGITEVFAPQLSTPVGRLCRKQKQKHSSMMWGRHQQYLTKKLEPTAKTRRKPGRSGVSAQVEYSDGFMWLNSASQGALLKGNGFQSDYGMWRPRPCPQPVSVVVTVLRKARLSGNTLRDSVCAK